MTESELEKAVVGTHPEKCYAKRNPRQLDKDGNYFSRHMYSLTAENLWDKADIAAELAWRDREIDRLKPVVEAAMERYHATSDKDDGIDYWRLCAKESKACAALAAWRKNNDGT